MPPRKKKRDSSAKSEFSKPGLTTAYILEHFSSIPDGPEMRNGHVLSIYINNTSVVDTIAKVKEKLHIPCEILPCHITNLVAKTVKKYRNLNRDSDKRKFTEICNEVYTSYKLTEQTFHPPSATASQSAEVPVYTSVETAPVVNEPSTPPRKVSPGLLRSSSRKALTPRCKALKRRLQFVTKTSVEKQHKYQSCVRSLKEELNSSRTRQLKYINQDIFRKRARIVKQNTEIKVLRAKLNKCEKSSNVQVMEKLQSEFNKLQKNHKKLRNYYKEKRIMGSGDGVQDESRPSDYYELDLNNKLKEKEQEICQLENEKLILEEKLSAANDNRSTVFNKQGISFTLDMRMFVYDSIIDNVPTSNISHLIKKFAQRMGFDVETVPKRSTIEMMVREMGVIADLQVGEFLANSDNLTLGFDATTQEGVHVNEIHVTSHNDCLVVSLDQLPGGTAEDYQLHIEESVDRVADIYSKFHEEDFNTTRSNMIKHIKNTLTDRVVVNHATISKLEESWDVSLNELNCHLHPLESVASKSRSALKLCETEKGRVFGNDCIAANLVLAINKFRYKDSKGDPKGFIAFLERAKLPKGIIPRYRGNRLHIIFLICGRLMCHHDAFLRFFSTGTVSCGGLQDAILADFNSSTGKVEMQVIGLVGKLLSGPWMTKFYTSTKSQTVNHVEGIGEVKLLLQRIKSSMKNPRELLNMKCNFFGEKLDIDEVVTTLQEEPCDATLFSEMVTAVLSAITQVLERQYARYFEWDITQELISETQSSRCHNMDAESVMGMFSASQERAPNATICYMSCKIRGQKNKVTEYLDQLEPIKKEKLVKLSINEGRKQRQNKRRKCAEIKEEIQRRLASKAQKKVTSDRKKVEKKLKDPNLDISTDFEDLSQLMQQGLRDILDGKIISRQIFHVWYDEELKQKTIYQGKIEKLKKKSGGMYVICYWNSDKNETYDDGVDFEVSKYELAADLLCEDMTMS